MRLGRTKVAILSAGALLTIVAWSGGAAATEWDIEAVDTAGVAGSHTSLALDSLGRPHISYYQEGTWRIRYAHWDGVAWLRETVGAPTWWKSSIAVDSMDQPHVAYATTGLPNQPLVIAHRTSPGAWSIEDVVDPCCATGSYVSFVFDASDNPHLAYREETTQFLKYAKRTGTVWSTEYVDTSGNTGYDVDLALDSLGDPHITYYDGSAGVVKYARKSGTTWSVEPVAYTGPESAYPSIALDSLDLPHVSYHDVVNRDLIHARLYGSVWVAETVDSQGWVGQFSSIAMDSMGRPRISYFDFSNGALRYAAWTGSQWDTEQVDYWNTGQYTSLALDGCDRPHISYYYFSPWQDLMYARGSKCPNHLTPEGRIEWVEGGDTIIHGTFAADVDKDGTVDILTVGEAYAGTPTKRNAQLRFLDGETLAVETNYLWAPMNGEAGFLGVYAEDVDDNGVVEVFAVGWAGSEANPNPIICTYTWVNRILGGPGCAIAATPGRFYSVHAANLVGDAKREVLVAGQLLSTGVSQGYLLFYTVQGSVPSLSDSTTWTNQRDVAAFGVFGADVDRDGRTEILTVGYTRVSTMDPMMGQLRIWKYAGSFSYTESVWSDPNGGAVEAFSVFAADLNRDATVDILTCGLYQDLSIPVNTEKGELRRYHGIGGPSLVGSPQRWQDQNGNECNSVYAANLNTDADLEIVTGGWSSLIDGKYGELRMWKYDLTLFGTPVQWHDLPGGPFGDTMVNAVYAKDVDGDGIVEIVTGGQVRQNNVWWAQLRVWYDP